jgi:hypothetical protein
MSEEERNGSVNSMEEFAKWYKKEKINRA